MPPGHPVPGSALEAGCLLACRVTASAPLSCSACALLGSGVWTSSSWRPGARLPVLPTRRALALQARRLGSARCAPGTTPSASATGRQPPSAVHEVLASELQTGSCCLERQGDWHSYGCTGPSQTLPHGGHSQEQLALPFGRQHSPQVGDLTLAVAPEEAPPHFAEEETEAAFPGRVGRQTVCSRRQPQPLPSRPLC